MLKKLCINKNLFLYFIFNIFIILIVINKNSFDDTDGFYSQMLNVFNNGFSFDLTLIHAIRFLIMSPVIFYSFNMEFSILYLILGFFIYTFPFFLFLKSFNNYIHKWILVISFLQFLFIFSERTFLIILSGLYLFIYFVIIKKKIFIVWGALFSILSSGNVLIFIIYLLIYSKDIFYKKIFIKILVYSVIFFIFSFSLFHKYDFFLNQEGEIFSIFLRSTLITSYIFDQKVRFLFVLFYLVVLLFLNLVIINSKINNNIKKFMVVSPLSFLFEGVTFYMYIPVILWIYLKYFKMEKREICQKKY